MEFQERTTAPDKNDKHYINYKNGGYSIAIPMDSTGFTLANCVGYCHGRLLELRNENKPNWSIPACNAEDWFEVAKRNGMQTGNVPKLGAVIVWKQGQLWNGYDGAGHVAVVEEIKDNGDIVVSSSHYNGVPFDRITLTKVSGYKYADTFELVGFIYCGIDFTPKPKPAPVYYRVQVGAFLFKSNAINRAKELQSKGFSTYLVKVGVYYKVQVGAYSIKANADRMLKTVQDAGYSAFITTEAGTAVSW